jgi:hypothetical protein
VKTVRTFML